MLERVQARLNLFEPSLMTTVHGLVLNHLRPAGYSSRSWSDGAIRRLLRDVGGGPGFDLLMQLSRADLTTKNPKKRAACERNSARLVEHVERIIAEDAAPKPKLPKLTMGLIKDRVAAKPGPWLNALRAELEALMLAGVLLVDQEPAYYVEAGLRLVEQHAGP